MELPPTVGRSDVANARCTLSQIGINRICNPFVRGGQRMSTAHQEARTHLGCAPSLDIGNLVPDEYRIAQVQAKMCCDVDNHSRLGFSTGAVDPIFWDDRVGQVWAMAHGGQRNT